MLEQITSGLSRWKVCLTLFQGGGILPSYSKDGGGYGMKLSFLGRNYAMDTKLGSITNLHKTGFKTRGTLSGTFFVKNRHQGI